MRALYDPNHDQGQIDQCVARIAAKQHGVFNRVQAKRCAASDGAIKWRLKVGRWELAHQAVYRLSGTPRTWRQQVMAACLFMGQRAALSHRAAAVLRGLIGIKRARVEVTVSRNRNRSKVNGIIIHWTRNPIPEDDITTIDGIRVTKPARTLLDLAEDEPVELIERALDDALRRRLVSLPFLERWLADPIRRKHPGAAMLQRLVDARATIGVTESPLEAMVLRLLREAALPIPMLQYEVRDGDRLIGRLDFAYPEHLVAIEADGFRYHDRRAEFDTERARGNELQAMGWRVLRITAKHLEQDPQGVSVWVRRALGLSEGKR